MINKDYRNNDQKEYKKGYIQKLKIHKDCTFVQKELLCMKRTTENEKTKFFKAGEGSREPKKLTSIYIYFLFFHMLPTYNIHLFIIYF